MAEQPVPHRDRHPDEDALVEVALGHADPAGRDEVTDHLALCAPCRRRYDDVADAVELVLPAVPRVAPPPGFESAALAGLASARAGGLGRVRAPDRARVPGLAVHDRAPAGVDRRTVLWAAAAGLLGVTAGAGATAYLTGREREPVASSPWSAPLLTADGRTVGFAAPSYDDRGEVLVVDVTDGEPGRSYVCRLRLRDGTTRDVATWALADDRPNSWVVPVGDGAVAQVELVAETGRTWATAQL